ncbi:MAG: SRPBCC family protein [Xanthomonadales bacterium]|nr:SRPBCC family protein [Xanthomonadales bacterium]
MSTSASHFDLTSHWRIAAPVASVWAALTDVRSWPQWWPYVRAVEQVDSGNAEGLGAVHRIRWATRLPYTIQIEVRSVEIHKHQRLCGRSRGQLEGQGTWLLRSAGDGITEVAYRWQVVVTKPWMRRLAPLLAPVFRWNHDGVMRAGERGLNRYLAQP